jgi:hypothetical protein
MSGTENSGWQNWGNPLLSTVLMLTGAGLTANRGALGPVLQLGGEMLGNARQSGINTAANKRLEGLLAPRERSVDIPGPIVSDVEGTAGGPTKRTERTGPTQPEIMQALAQMQGVSEPVRNALLEHVMKLRLPASYEPSEEIRRERDIAQTNEERRRQGVTGERLLAEQGVPPGVRTAARGVIEAGGRPHVEVPPRLEAEERAFQQEVAQGKHGDPKTAEGLYRIELAARERGLHKVADEYAKGRTTRKDYAEETRVTQVRETLIPRWNQQVEALRRQGVSSVSLAGVEAAIATAEQNPSPAAVAAVTRSFASIGRQEEQRRQFDTRVKQWNQRAQAVMQAKNQSARAAQARALYTQITREIAQGNKEAEYGADPVARVHAAARVEELRALQDQLRDVVYASAMGNDEAPGAAPPASTPSAPRYRLTPDNQLIPIR